MRRFRFAAGCIGLLLGLLLALLQPATALALRFPPGQTFIPGETFRLGGAGQLPEEQEAAGVQIRAFCLQSHGVTNREFAAFVAATGYRTVAERPLSPEQFPGLSASDSPSSRRRR